ncbi:PHB depolymerase family esterase [Catellatospora sp. KI3]|uniref:alpha/beta hydrolase family esterase n=1 Tax=Catellatospora sp. KI3 TaxID=3041620 RepID=UPI002482C9A4|nr:PHB depolymerase family esterase [Catellatospora sp. KI3]MDI1461886.1 PHB depolymerase family esterase [Catellatospora sp. KI3]
MKQFAVLLTLATVLTGCAATGTPPAAAPSPAVSLPPEQPGPGDHDLALMHGGVRRDYRLHAPPGWTPGTALPLVLVFHGQPGKSTDAERTSRMSPLADTKGFLVAYPQGFGDRWNTSRTGGADDVGFIGALLDHLVKEWGADPKRTYAAGFSNGAAFTYRLARDLPGRFGALAPVSGRNETEPDGAGPLAAPVSLLTFQGSTDRFAGSWPGTNNQWRRLAACGEPAVQTLTGPHGKAHRYTASCGNGTEHVVYSVIGMGHEWPDGGAHPVDANTLIWAFFTAHPQP